MASRLRHYLYDRLTVTGPNGYNTIYEMHDFDDRNVISRITNSIGRVTSYDFDTSYRVTRIVYPEGNEMSVIYDTFGNITSRTMKPKAGLRARCHHRDCLLRSVRLRHRIRRPALLSARVVSRCPR